MSIMDLKKKAPKGEFLAYINKEEAAMLKKAGGSGKLVNGIPSFRPQDYGQEARAKGTYGFDKKDFDETDESNPYSKAAQDKNKELNERVRRNAEIREDIRKRELEKDIYDVAPKKNVFEDFGSSWNSWHNKRNLDWAKKNKAKKEKALRDYLNDQLSIQPHMDVDEIMAGLEGSYDPSTNTFGTHQFTSGINKGTTFDLSKYGGSQLGPFGLSTTGVTGQPLGTNYLDQTPDFTSHPSNVPTIAGAFLNKINPMNMNTLKSHFNRTSLLDNLIAKGDDLKQADIDDYYDRTMGRGDYNIFGPDQSGDPYIPPLPFQQVLPEEEAERQQKEFAYRFGDTQKVGADVLRGYVANGGRITRAGGGIMNAVPRQGFFLGKIAKGIGKAVSGVAKAAGKVLKSDLGKMALLYGAGAMAGSYGLKGSLFSKGMFNPMNMKAGLFGASNVALNKLGLTEMAAKKGLLAKLGLTQGYGSLLPTWKGGIAALTALPLLGIGTEAKQDTLGDGTRGQRLLDSQGNEALPADLRAEVRAAYESGDADKIAAINDYYNFLPGLNAVRLPDIKPYLPYPNYADGGRIKAQEGGLMDMGGMEKDYRNEGGFVPIGREEKADDVPARLSVNEFVFTADAVRNAGGGDIDKGAEVMENMMKNLENGGKVSEESQGNTGAQEMFSVSERIGEVI